MPSKTFLNLPKEKQKKLIQSATEEFSSHNFMDVSINRIINSVNIPRGSFYMYFNDKEDLFEYLLESYTQKLKIIIAESLKINKGDLRDTFVYLYDEITKRIKKIKIEILFRNAFIYLNLNRNKFNYIIGNELFNTIKSDIDKRNIKSIDLEFIFKVLMHNLFMAITDSIHIKDSNLEKEFYIKRLDMICYGFYK